MDTHASFPVELRKAAVVAEEETKARSFYLPVSLNSPTKDAVWEYV